MMQQVTKARFYGAIFDGGLDVHPTITNDRYPYSSDWKFHRKPGTPLFGRTVDRIEGGQTVTDYFLVVSQ